MSAPFVGQLSLVAFNFPPRGWAQCAGQILPLSQNTALFSLLGTMYGGDGKSTFALPDLQGRIPVGMGTGPGLSPVDQGELSGVENVTLLQTEVPPHSHFLNIYDQRGGTVTQSPANGVLAKSAATEYAVAANLTQKLAIQTISPQGGSLPHNNLMPFLSMNWIIALQGVFPPRS